MIDQLLLLIDVQTGFDDPAWGQRNNPQAEENIATVLKTWRSLGLPVIHVRHASLEEGSPLAEDREGFNYKPEGLPKPGEKEFVKHVNSAFIGTELHEYLQEKEIKDLLIAGFTTDHCISTSVRMAGNLGYRVTLLSDATATFERRDQNGVHYTAEQIHSVHLASLNGEFCRVLSIEQTLKNLNRS